MMISVTLSKSRLNNLCDVIERMHKYVDKQTNNGEDVPTSGYAAFDERMADWREDVTLAAEALIWTIEEAQE